MQASEPTFHQTLREYSLGEHRLPEARTRRAKLSRNDRSWFPCPARNRRYPTSIYEGGSATLSRSHGVRAAHNPGPIPGILSLYMLPGVCPRNISGHDFAVLLVFRSKPLLQAWLLHPEHVYVANGKESQGEEQDRWRAKIQAQTDEQG